MSYLPPFGLDGLGAVPAGRADPAACAELQTAVEQYRLWSAQPDTKASTAERARHKARWDALKAQRACRPAVTAAPAGFVPLSRSMYNKYPQLEGARIKNGYTLHKGPGVSFYIRDAAGNVVPASRGTKATSSGPLFRGGSGTGARTTSPQQYQAPVVLPRYTIPARPAFGRDQGLPSLATMFQPQYQSGLPRRRLPAWAAGLGVVAFVGLVAFVVTKMDRSR